MAASGAPIPSVEAPAPPAEAGLRVVLVEPGGWAPRRQVVPGFSPWQSWSPGWSAQDPLADAVLAALVIERRQRAVGWTSPEHTATLVALWAEARSCEAGADSVGVLAALEAERRSRRGDAPDLRMVSCLAARVHDDPDATSTRRHLATLYVLDARVAAGSTVAVSGVLALLEQGVHETLAFEAGELLRRLPARDRPASADQLAELHLRVAGGALPPSVPLADWALAQALRLGEAELATAWLALRAQAVEIGCRGRSSCEDLDQLEAEVRVAVVGGPAPSTGLGQLRALAWRCGVQADLGEEVAGRAAWQDGWRWEVSGHEALDACIEDGLGGVAPPEGPTELPVWVVPAS